MSLADSMLLSPAASPAAGPPNLYKALVHIGRATLHETSADGLCLAVCRAAVEADGFILAWVGRHDPDRQLLVPAHRWGDDHQALDTLKIFTDERPELYGPTGRAFRTESPCVCNDFLSDPSAAGWRREAEQLGIRAAAAFPFRWQDATRGTLTLYAREADYFQAEEVALLQQAVAARRPRCRENNQGHGRAPSHRRAPTQRHLEHRNQSLPG